MWPRKTRMRHHAAVRGPSRQGQDGVARRFARSRHAYEASINLPTSPMKPSGGPPMSRKAWCHAWSSAACRPWRSLALPQPNIQHPGNQTHLPGLVLLKGNAHVAVTGKGSWVGEGAGGVMKRRPPGRRSEQLVCRVTQDLCRITHDTSDPFRPPSTAIPSALRIDPRWATNSSLAPKHQALAPTLRDILNPALRLSPLPSSPEHSLCQVSSGGFEAMASPCRRVLDSPCNETTPTPTPTP